MAISRRQVSATCLFPLSFCGLSCSTSVHQALKSVKGVLNKLTPEKFDRLLGQLVAAVTSVDVLNGLIKLVFDNAVRVVWSPWQLSTSIVSTVPCSFDALRNATLCCRGLCKQNSTRQVRETRQDK